MKKNNLRNIQINQLTCDSCGCCVSTCPQEALTLNEKNLVYVKERCNYRNKCNRCILVCPVGALKGENHEPQV